MSIDDSPVVLAYSGGLDTSFCIPWLKQQLKREVITVTVDTGGIDKKHADILQDRAFKLGAMQHHIIDAKKEFFHKVIKYLIAGNIRKGHLYPLCVGAERGLQAEKLAVFAKNNDLNTVAHGCTAAGNDQVRFDIALRTLNPKLTILAPIRDNNWARKEQLRFLKKNNLPISENNSNYSVNRGLWGVTIGGKETLTSIDSIPEDAWPLSANAFNRNLPETNHVIGFEQGVPTSLDNEKCNPVLLIEKLEELCRSYAIGRGIHLGDTILGTKGRVAFEAPAAVTLIKTHRELEKLVLTALQIKIKELLAPMYGDFVHEGKQLDLASRDIEAFFESSQRRVTGEVKFSLKPGNLFITGVTSPYSLMQASSGLYGEKVGEWTATDASGFSKILSLSGSLQSIATRKLEKEL
tara:strand:- start:2187 stop:3410 length:1224 start_codon:yes stop_codon:yes gene_type:complete